MEQSLGDVPENADRYYCYGLLLREMAATTEAMAAM